MLRIPILSQVAGAFLILSSFLPANATTWTIDRATSTLTFEAAQAGVPFQGAFETFTAEIEFDPSAPDAAQIHIVIETGSAKTGAADKDSTLPTADWFDVASHPTATFTSTASRSTENGYVADGTLTIKGQSQTVALPFSLEIDGTRAHATGSLTIDRNEFGVGTGPLGPMVDNDVTISFSVHATSD